MAIKDMISPGIGFTPGSVEYIVTRGLDAGPAIVVLAPAGGIFRMGLNRLELGLSWIVGALRRGRERLRPQPGFAWSFAE